MAVCRNCGKKGLFLKLKDGLCRECYVDFIKSQNENSTDIGDVNDGFFEENIEMIKTVEYEIQNNRRKMQNTDSPEEKSRLIDTNLNLFKELEEFCISKGGDGKRFFEERYKSFIQYELDMLKK